MRDRQAMLVAFIFVACSTLVMVLLIRALIVWFA